MGNDMNVKLLSISHHDVDAYIVRVAVPEERTFIFRIRTLDGARIVQAPEEFFRLVSSWNRPYGAVLAAVGAFDRAHLELGTL